MAAACNSRMLSVADVGEGVAGAERAGAVRPHETHSGSDITKTVAKNIRPIEFTRRFIDSEPTAGNRRQLRPNFECGNLTTACGLAKAAAHKPAIFQAKP